MSPLLALAFGLAAAGAVLIVKRGEQPRRARWGAAAFAVQATSLTPPCALLAGAAFALPSSRERFEARAARRAAGLRASHPKISNETHPEYSSNWAGAVLNSAAVRHLRRHVCSVLVLTGNL